LDCTLVGDRGQCLARHPLCGDLAAGRAADHPAVAERGGGAGRCDLVAAVPPRDPAAADPDHRGGDDLFGAVHLHRLPADLRADPRRPGERHPPDGDAVVPARDPRRSAGRGRGHRGGDDPVPAGRHPVLVLRPAAAPLATGRGRLMAQDRATAQDDVVGMEQYDTPLRRIVVIYLPLAVFIFVLLFPFYWMAITAVKPNHQLTNYNDYSPFWVVGPTLEH